MSDLQSQPLAHAYALAPRLYADPQMPALDRAAVFARGWQLVAHQSQLATVGDFVATDIVGLPVVVLRDEGGRLRAYHNVCRHRAGPLASGSGCAQRLRCRYHGWTYGLDGVLRSAPEMETAEGFNPAQVRLPELQLAIWQGLVFVAEQPQVPFQQVVAGMDERFGERRLDHYRWHTRVRYELGCNWKVYVDNYLEGYHVPHIHPGLNKLLDYRSYVTHTADWYSYQYSPMESAELYGKGDALYYFVWPNTMLNSLPDRLQTNRVLPLGVDRCLVEFDYYYPADPADPAAQRRLREDMGLCELVQQGLASGGYQPGRLNPLRESGVHHFHELLRATYRAEGG